MGHLKTSVLVLLLAVVLSRIPGWLKTEPKVPPVVGHVEPGWEHVRDVYRSIFTEGDCRGNSFGVYYKGKPVVDLRGGFANEKELWPWQENTLTRLYSTTKGISAVVIGVLVDRGLIKYDDLVIKYWPEFGVHGKDKITVEMLLSHQTGLLTISDKSYSIWNELNDTANVARVLAAEKPKWEIGTAVGYHAYTVGMYMDQLVRRIDSKHRNIAQFFHEEIAEPLGLDIRYGLEDTEAYRATSIEICPLRLKYLFIPFVREYLWLYLFGWMWDDTPDYMADFATTYQDPEIDSMIMRVRPDVNKLWNPSVYSYGNGRELSKLFGILANGGSHNGKKIMSPATVELQTHKMKSGRDQALKFDLTYGRGYTMLQSPKGTPMFGTPGYGGQMGYADPKNKLGIGFTSNYLSMTGLKDHRYLLLEEAVYDVLDRLNKK